MRFQAFMNGTGDFYRDVSSSTDLTARGWTSYYINWEDTTNSSGLEILLDGAMPFQVTESSSDGPRQDDISYALVIGNTRWANVAFNEAYYDEIRISNVVRSADWISLQEASLRDTLLSFGSEEALEY